MRILGIETSCDETGVAIYDTEAGLLADALYSQVSLHAEFGGVVPELASRDHVRRLVPLVDKVMEQAGCQPADLDAVAYTAGPGLAGALLVGASFAKSLAWGWGVPAVPVHHMEGHLLAPLLEEEPPAFPFVALLVSGGHTQLLEASGLGQYRLLGESLDDAAGEAFDKAAKMMGLGYPGGPQISQWGEQGDSERFHFPRPMIDRPGMDFSFSGLKTYTLNTVQDCQQKPQGLTDADKADISRAFEEAVVDTIVIKCRRAMEETGHKTLVMAGGVSANKRLRQKLQQKMADRGVRLYFPRQEYCTDNGAMIAFAGAMRLLVSQSGDEDGKIAVRARWPLAELEPA